MESQTERKGRANPQRLGEKLKRIRLNGGLSQGKMLLIVNPDERTAHNRARVSQYERMKRIPSLIETHNYARYAGVPVEILIDDELDLPTVKTAKRKRKKSPAKNHFAGEKNSAVAVKKNAFEMTAECAAAISNELFNTIKAESKVTSDSNTQIDFTQPLNATDRSTVITDAEKTDVNEADEIIIENERSNIRSYQENLLALPLVIEAEKVRENSSLELPAETLDKLDDLLLDIRREMPRYLRSSVQTNDVINFCLSVILTNYADHRKNSLVMFQTRKLIEESERTE